MKHNDLEPFNEPSNKRKNIVKKSIKLKEEMKWKILKNEIEIKSDEEYYKQ